MATIMIVSGESSGELYGSLLAKAIKRKMPGVHIIGVGGERMHEAGVELVSRISDAFGLVEAVSAYGKIRSAFKRTVEAFRQFKPQVLVLIDYPDFNLKVGKIAKSLNIKILYYVSPQIWAWRKGRIKKIAGLVDRMAVILPFEEEIYRTAGVTCEFVGHPILEEIEAVLTYNPHIPPIIPPCPPLRKGGWGDLLNGEKARIKSALGLDPDKPLISLLPGSRPSELNRHLPLMADVIKQFRNDPEIKAGHNYQFCIPFTPNTDEKKYKLHLEKLRQEGVVIAKGESVRVLAASDMAVVASGTATLQTALLEIPMVVIYRLSPLTYQLGKRIVKVKHISLVNILSGKEVVKELLQDRANAGEIVKELKKMMFDTKYRADMILSFTLLKEPFSGKRASDRVAEMVREMSG